MDNETMIACVEKNEENAHIPRTIGGKENVFI